MVVKIERFLKYWVSSTTTCIVYMFNAQCWLTGVGFGVGAGEGPAEGRQEGFWVGLGVEAFIKTFVISSSKNIIQGTVELLADDHNS